MQKWKESGFRPPLCAYRLNWAKRTSWGWWNDTVLQTHDSKFEPWRSEAEHATSRPRRLPTILSFTRGWVKNIFVSLKPARPGTKPRTSLKGSGANHNPMTPPLKWCGQCVHAQQTTKHLYNISTTSSQRLRRWSAIVQMFCTYWAGWIGLLIF